MHEPRQRLSARLGSRFAGTSRSRWLLTGAAVMILVSAAGFALASAAGPKNVQTHARADAVGRSAHARLGALGGRSGSRAPSQGRLGPVLLVPGYGGGTGSLDVLASRIRAAGRRAIVLRLPGTGTGSLVADAAVLNAAVARAVRRGAPSVDVIGYSAGGVVALLWARHDDGASQARRIVTLGAPFHGTELAAAAQALVPRQCPAACRQLVPGSPLLASLDVASGSGLPPWLSLWTADDQVVTPPNSARLAGAIDVPVQAVCATLTVSHTQLPSNPAVINMVLGAIGRTPLARPASTSCS
jgi:triacylglycerol esterase/lipase EstA (alpha/beta hydrolase family)